MQITRMPSTVVTETLKNRFCHLSDREELIANNSNNVHQKVSESLPEKAILSRYSVHLPKVEET